MTGSPSDKSAPWADSTWERLFPGMTGRQVLTLYVAVPVAIGAVLGWYQAGYTTDYPQPVAVLEWVVNFFTLWIAFDLGSRLIAFLVRPWKAPLWAILIVGGVAGVAVSRPLRSVVRDFTGQLAPNANPDIALPAGMVWEEMVFAYAGVVAMPILMWVVVNYIFADGLGVPRYGYMSKRTAAGRLRDADASDDPALVIAPPEFTKRMESGETTDVWALQAEDHYLRVFTDGRDELIRYRFSDAVNDVRDLPGMQVHRSFWVNTQAIDSIKRAGRSYEVVLKNGLKVPVSRSYRYAVKEAGLLSKFPSRPSPLFNDDGVSKNAAE